MTLKLNHLPLRNRTAEEIAELNEVYTNVTKMFETLELTLMQCDRHIHYCEQQQYKFHANMHILDISLSISQAYRDHLATRADHLSTKNRKFLPVYY